MADRHRAHAYDIINLGDLLPATGLPLFCNRPVQLVTMPFHDHDYLEVAIVHGGAAVHQGIHGQRPIGRGDVLVLHPGQWHGYDRCQSLDLSNLCIPVALLAHELGWLAADPQVAALLPVRGAATAQAVCHLHATDAVMPMLEGAVMRVRELIEQRQAVRARAEIIALAASVLARLAGLLGRRHVPRSDDDGVVALAAAMANELTRAWTLAELARRADMTREHLCRRFRRVHGASPLAWLTMRRAERAAVLLLTTDAPVAAIGRQVGWDDANYCARRFKAAFGVNPAAYRNRVPAVVTDVQRA